MKLRVPIFAPLIGLVFAVILRFWLQWIGWVGSRTDLPKVYEVMGYVGCAGFVLVSCLITLASWNEAKTPRWIDRTIALTSFAGAMWIVFFPA